MVESAETSAAVHKIEPAVFIGTSSPVVTRAGNMGSKYYFANRYSDMNTDLFSKKKTNKCQKENRQKHHQDERIFRIYRRL